VGKRVGAREVVVGEHTWMIVARIAHSFFFLSPINRDIAHGQQHDKLHEDLVRFHTFLCLRSEKHKGNLKACCKVRKPAQAHLCNHGICGQALRASQLRCIV
jgi:hypothetical protein